MNDKLTINTTLLRKEPCYEPKPCIVERVVEMSAGAFAKLISKPLDDHYLIKKNSDLMFSDGDVYHCILAVDKLNGDGLLIEAEGSGYARYSQYIPHAKDIVAHHDMTPAQKAFQEAIKEIAHDLLAESGEKTEVNYSLDELLLNAGFRRIIKDSVCDAFKAMPEVGSVEIRDGDLHAVKKELVETRLVCPLSIVMEPDDYETDMIDTPSDQLMYCDEEINKKIRESMCDEDEEQRGFMAYSDDEHLRHKVFSVFPSVETIGNDLYGVVTVMSYGELNKTELEELSDEITGQLSDGWGEGFEQHPVTIGGEDYYISFWNSDDFYLKPESEVFQSPTQSLKM